jgi:hypothetical protein
LSVLAPDGSWTTYTSEDSGLVYNAVHVLAIDEATRVWVGTRWVGLSVLAPDGSWTTYTPDNSGLVDDCVEALAIDEAGRVWVGTQRNGLSVFAHDESWTTSTSGDSGLADDLQTLAEVVSILELVRNLAVASFVILLIGRAIQRRRGPAKSPALERALIIEDRTPQEQPGTSSVPAAQVPSVAEIALAEGKVLLSQGNKDEAVAFFMHAFREGPPNVRQEAIRILEELGEMKTL